MRKRPLLHINFFVGELMKHNSATEEQKAGDPMKWMGLINNLKAQAEETVLAELICD